MSMVDAMRYCRHDYVDRTEQIRATLQGVSPDRDVMFHYVCKKCLRQKEVPPWEHEQIQQARREMAETPSLQAVGS